ncbi:MAG: alanine--tRNA ligase [Alphaproteobacteria bacterium]|nr:alanine--tRNA ligase [Alphaproteobacteria bacterium]
MTSANDIRTSFLEFFRRNEHEVVASSPLVPRNDPTLMFTSAGMVQFKNLFTGIEKRSYVRAATAQKCMRAGGKHNDLENVGYTARHCTFFEMLGNFSFGDYFKERAITHAWNFVTQDLALPKEKLLVTVYHEDDEAAELWKKIAGFSDSKIIRIATSDNFWSAGDTGPCGPCSEIFYDQGDKIWGGPPGSAEQDGDRFLEFWNLVFMQFDQIEPGKRVPLPRPSIDTGMGLERIASLMQGKQDVYDTDILRALVLASSDATGVAPDGEHRASHKVIADHIRASSFLIADGVMPSNEGRGYVLRRIMRRGMRHAHILGAREPLLWKLVPVLVGQMGQAYPELGRAQALIQETLKLEETRFRQTLDRGLRLLGDETKKMKMAKGASLPGEVAFKLYDTFGFPVDLTADILRGQGFALDQAGFDAAMERQRETARAAWSGSGEAATDRVWFEIREKAGATDFLGYATDKAEARIDAIVVDGKQVTEASGGDVAVVLNQTPFYAESGGQMGDMGTIVTASGARIEVSDTAKRVGDLHVHLGKLVKGTIKLGDTVAAEIDVERRRRLRANHSATHLLHEALRRQLGEHVTQKGSLVAPDRLRFDFSHPRAIEAADLQVIETEVNTRIRLNQPVGTTLMTPDDAVAAGAMALFGEKYGDEVRVVSMGGGEGEKFSVELCGGTHVERTGDIGLFKIVSEGAVAAGIRRLEAATGAGALAYVAEEEKLLQAAASALRTAPADLPARVAQLVEDKRKLERELAEARKALALGGTAKSPAANRSVAGMTLAARTLDGVPARELKGMVDALKKEIGSGVVVLVAREEGKASLVVGVTDDLTAKVSAVDLVKAGAAALGGKGGGGRPDMAQAGGPDAAKADDAIAAIEAAMTQKAA